MFRHAAEYPVVLSPARFAYCMPLSSFGMGGSMPTALWEIGDEPVRQRQRLV
jgi:hypothetical protein